MGEREDPVGFPNPVNKPVMAQQPDMVVIDSCSNEGHDNIFFT